LQPLFPVISPTTLSQYIRLEKCERYLRLRLRPDELRDLQNRYKDLGVSTLPLTPLLREAGESFETEVVASLSGQKIDLRAAPETNLVDLLKGLEKGESLILVQPELKGTIGEWPCQGRADLISVTLNSDGAVDWLVADMKASRHDRVEYHVQVAFYSILFEQLLVQNGFNIGHSNGAILMPGEDGTLPSLEDTTQFFDLAPFQLILDQLLSGEDGDLKKVNESTLDKVPYFLGTKCDRCPFNQICFTESTDRQDVALTPYIGGAEITALRNHGLKTLRDLAILKELPGPNAFGAALRPALGKETLVASLNLIQPLGPDLDRLVQRARARLYSFDKTIQSYRYLLDGGFSQLPNDEENPDLVKIFLDGQDDYVKNRLYLAGALVKGPRGTIPIVHMTPGPPGPEDEAQLMVNLLEELFAAIRQVAADPEVTPLHVYVYDGAEQKAWLDALTRNISMLLAIPTFYDLLTTSPALDQLMVSIIAAEIRERKNFGQTCQNLYSVGSLTGFTWNTPEDAFRAKFFLRIFDQTIPRADGIWIEKSSRYSSDIPVEYAYGAWGLLPADTKERGLLRPYLECSPELIKRFQIHRLKAIAHIEANLGVKNRQLVKEPIAIASLGQAPAPLAGLERALQEFLAIEHHTAHQQLLAHFARPIERRVQTGRSLLLECREVKGGKPPTACFRLAYDSLALDSEVARQGLRVKEGDWMVLNPVEETSPWKLIHGRLAIVTALSDKEIELELLNQTFKNSSFKYWHNLKLDLAPGRMYTLDEMADDLNSDKFLEALGNTGNNHFYNLVAGTAVVQPLAVKTNRIGMFMNVVKELEKANPPTLRQRNIIGGHLEKPLLCVQGPPGSGKTATLGWAVLGRLFALDERPLRVAVCARTHKATNLVLESISTRLKTFRETREGRSLGQVNIYKVAAESSDGLPAGVQALSAYRADQCAAALSANIAIIGATPGGLFTLVKQYAGKQMDWNLKLFDLLIIDEASQMSLPEAITAGAFLKPNGQILVVGDHRQMPPILAHSWKNERKRTALDYKPHRSIFETLLEQGFPVEGLDESFRLHRVQAAFLGENIYRKDSINFHSRREKVLAPLPATFSGPDFVRQALRPDYPVVVIEHNEQSSQQFNQLEMDLTTGLISTCEQYLGLDPAKGLGIVVPHNAQKASLRSRFSTLAAADAIDTVERFQGGERDVIIVSATASDPGYVLAEATFLINLNRLNVAISRPKLKLIVIASSSIFRLLTDDQELFDNAMLWKDLRYKYACDKLWEGKHDGYKVRMFGKHCGHPIQALPSIPMITVPPTTGPKTRSYISQERTAEEW